MPKVVTYKKLKDETETIMSYGDVISIIEENLGSEIVDALLDFENEEIETPEHRCIKFIEDGIWDQQIEESGVIESIVKQVVEDLDSQGFIKKNRNLDKFNYEYIYYKEIIDEKLSPGIMKYFES